MKHPGEMNFLRHNISEAVKLLSPKHSVLTLFAAIKTNYNYGIHFCGNELNKVLIYVVQAFVKEIDTVESSLKDMKEVETHLQSCPVAGIKTWVQTKLVDYQTQLEKCSKEVSFSALLSVFFKR